jgi:hypothetical protein
MTAPPSIGLLAARLLGGAERLRRRPSARPLEDRVTALWLRFAARRIRPAAKAAVRLLERRET